MSKSSKLRVTALALAIVAIVPAAPSAWAFSTENINANQNGNSRFADPDDQVKNGQTPFGPNGPTVHFGTSSNNSGASPFSSRFGGNANSPPPNPYAMPPGQGN
jgi:hypothetical protein